MTLKHPYQAQPDQAFWKKTVSNQHPLEITHWYKKKFPISHHPIATAGSCFAQHIGKQLKEQGFDYLDVEPAPAFLPKDSRLDFGYDMYSARYGNVYSSRQLVQLAQRALGQFAPEESYWIKDDGYVDPFRPTIEAAPYGSIEELNTHREYHLECVRKLFKEAQIFVFTLGLTETWVSKRDGAAYPMAPGVAGGVYDPEKYQLLNLTWIDVVNDLEKFFKLVRRVNNTMRFILTVSPVPLMATATEHQVVVATMHSKSVLRAAAGYLADDNRYVDYFPSYEIIAAPPMRAQFYNPDMRTISPYGVDFVMKQFFKEHEPPRVVRQDNNAGADGEHANDDVLCDEELLAVFGA